MTVLVADMVGFTPFVEKAGEEAAYALMGRISHLMTEAVHRQHGNIKSFTGDGIMVLFGAPMALEDAPLRACRAALQIQQRLAEAAGGIEAELGIRPQMRISLTAGPVVLGEVEAGESTGVTAYGDIVNLAARLQVEAVPGTVVISEAMLGQLEGMVETELAGVFRFKGKADPQRVYRLVGIRENATRFDARVARGLTTYIGRAREIAVLEDRFRNLDSVRAIDIVGDPGIGKSRLLYEFTRRLQAAHAVILQGNCSTDGHETPFLPFIEVVRRSFSVVAGEAEATIAGKLDEGLRRLGHASQQNLGLLLNLLGLKAPEGALKGLDGTLIGARTRDLLLSLLKAQCRFSPVVLLLEDVHWIDRASEELLSRIVDEEGPLPLLILHTRRPESRPAWTDRPGVVALPLAPLSSAETLRIAQIRFGVDELPESLARLVVEKAEGNALFIEEIASFLIERGTVRRTPSGLAYDANAVAAALPASVESLLTARVDRLTHEDRALLQVAAVIGRRFDPELLAAVAEIPNIEQQLGAIEALDLVQFDTQSGDCVFKHLLMRDALYGGLVSPLRAELHLKVANAIELRGANRIAEVAEVLAHHYSNSAQHDKAFYYLSFSGQKCLDIYSLEEAEGYLRRALTLLAAAPQCAGDQAVATVIANLLEVLYLKGDILGLRDIADTYIPRLQTLGDTPQLVFALYFHSMVLANHCDFRAAEARANLALEIAERLGDVRAQAYALSALLFCSTVLGRDSLEIAEAEGARMLDACTRAGDNYILNWAYWSIAWDYVCRGLTREARAWAQKLIEAGQQRRDNRALGMAYWTLAWIDMQDRRYGDGIANAQKCLGTAATPFDRIAGTMASATGMLLEGRINEGLTKLLTLKKWALDNGWLYAASGADYAAGPALAFTGHVAEGIRMLESGIGACDANGCRAMASWNRLALAELYLHMLSTRERPPMSFVLANLGAIVRVRLFGAHRAQALLDEASGNEQFHDSGATRCRIEIDFARLCRQRRQSDRARQHLNKARIAATALDSPPMLHEIDTVLRSLD